MTARRFPSMVRHWFYALSVLSLVLIALFGMLWPGAWWALVVIGPLIAVGLYDVLQSSHTILRNFPVIGHGRYFVEMVRPEVQQYLIESPIDAFPVEREMRAVIYQRAKGELDTKPLGTQRDVYRVGYEWAAHSISPIMHNGETLRVDIGGADCTQPYSASLLNVSAMSFGSLSGNAILALNRAAKAENFAHNTGEGGLSRYHREPGGDLIWQIGTGYFGCRTTRGDFDESQFRDNAQVSSVRMIEIKLSQGAKPGHGGILPGVKVSNEIAEARGVPPGETIVSPPGHSAFSTPIELIEFVGRLRDLSGGKPVGFKLSVGRRGDVFSICKAMLETGIMPDFITVDGGEGGTGAAPIEFTNSMGMPARDAWIFVHTALCGTGLRDKIRIGVSGKIFTGFHMLRALAMGADFCLSARGMMFALGCIQSLRCNTNKCPTGITTQDPALTHGLVVKDKSERVARWHRATINSLQELLGSMGCRRTDELRPEHIFRRVDDLRVRNLAELYDFLDDGQLLADEDVPETLRHDWERSRADYWSLKPERGQYEDE